MAVTIASTVLLLALLAILNVDARWFADSFIVPAFAPVMRTDLYDHAYAQTLARLMWNVHEQHAYDRAALERELEIIKRHAAALLEAEHEHQQMFEIARQRLGTRHPLVPFPGWTKDETTSQLEFTNEVLQIIEAQRKTLWDSCGVADAQRLF